MLKPNGCFFFPEDYPQNLVKKWFKLGSQMVTDDTLWTPAKTKSFYSVMRGSALPFCFPSHTGAGQTSLWEPKLFRHMRNNLLRGHFKLNQTTASKCLQETHTHMYLWLSVDERLKSLSPTWTVPSGGATQKQNNALPFEKRTFAKLWLTSLKASDALSSCHSMLRGACCYVFSSLAKGARLKQDLQHLSSDVHCYSVDLSLQK